MKSTMFCLRLELRSKLFAWTNRRKIIVVRACKTINFQMNGQYSPYRGKHAHKSGLLHTGSPRPSGVTPVCRSRNKRPCFLWTRARRPETAEPKLVQLLGQSPANATQLPSFQFAPSFKQTLQHIRRDTRCISSYYSITL